jgi:hypothetical protein
VEVKGQRGGSIAPSREPERQRDLERIEMEWKRITGNMEQAEIQSAG